LAKAVATPLEKSLPKELRFAVNDALEKSLFDNNEGVRFADTISQAVMLKLETTLQNDLSSSISTMFETSFAPFITKLDERIHASIEKSTQQIQKENRASQQETVKKLENLMEGISQIVETLKTEVDSRAMSPSNDALRSLSRKQTMAEFFKAGKYTSGIEIVYLF
jgi:hypothetical protein